MKYLGCLILVGLTFVSRAQADAKILSHGKDIYMTNCVACHGEKGDGRGPASVAINGPKPRNFIEGKFKYGSTADQIFKTISDGVKDSAMPSWKSLPEEDRRAVIQYILSLKAS